MARSNLTCMSRPQFADLVEKQRAAGCFLEFADVAVDGAVKAPRS